MESSRLLARWQSIDYLNSYNTEYSPCISTIIATAATAITNATAKMNVIDTAHSLGTENK